MDTFHAFFESLDAWAAAAIPGCPVYAMQYTHTQTVNRAYGITQTAYIVQLSQIEHNTAHHVCFIVERHDSLQRDQADACNARSDQAYARLKQWLFGRDPQFDCIYAARVGVPDDMTITYTYLPKGFIDGDTPQS
jgi:hypothetical protein